MARHHGIISLPVIANTLNKALLIMVAMVASKNMIVKLSDTEINLIHVIGTMRFNITSEKGTDRNQSGADGLNMSIDGVMSEYAVAKLLNVHFDFNCDFRKFGADLIGRTGKTIDVKSTRKQGGNLNAVKWSENKPAEIFILTEIGLDFVDVVGFITRNDFLIDENLTDVGKGEFYSVPRSKLRML
jgi:hypothetical protein